jgi:PD-(D/E)XK nuclease superfamily
MPEINWDAVFDKIAASSIPDWDREIVAAGVVKALDWFYSVRDKEYTVKGVELFGTDPASFKIDLYLTKDGEHKAVDWKFRKSGKLNENWDLRETRSWQSRIYAAALATAYGPGIFPLTYEVRGIAPQSDDPLKCQVKILSMSLTREVAVAAVHYLRDISAMRQALIDTNRFPWTKDPAGCRCFGPMYACAYEEMCWNGGKVPDLDLTKLQDLRPLSHSATKSFLRCPQYYALGVLLGKPDEEEDVTAAGKLFHEVMEMTYRQLLSDETYIDANTSNKVEPPK